MTSASALSLSPGPHFRFLSHSQPPSGPPPVGPTLAILDEESGLINIDGSTVGEGKTVRIACSDGHKLTRWAQFHVMVIKHDVLHSGRNRNFQQNFPPISNFFGQRRDILVEIFKAQWLFKTLHSKTLEKLPVTLLLRESRCVVGVSGCNPRV